MNAEIGQDALTQHCELFKQRQHQPQLELVRRMFQQFEAIWSSALPSRSNQYRKNVYAPPDGVRGNVDSLMDDAPL